MSEASHASFFKSPWIKWNSEGEIYVQHIFSHLKLSVTGICLWKQRIKQLQRSSKNDNLVLRLAVEGGGCSGFQYVFKMEDRVKAALEASAEPGDDEDEVVEDR
jgi:Fe-S cluster assembly iron-binding protein IscA